MKALRRISTFVKLGLATFVTAGSLYVTASAAAHRESTELDSATPAVESANGQASDESITSTGRQHYVVLDKNGGFTGRLSSLNASNGKKVSVSDIKVTLVRQGAQVGTTATDTSGQFTFTGLSEGVVSIWAESEESLMLFSFVLLGHDISTAESSEQVGSHVELAMDSVVAAGSDKETVKELITSYLKDGNRSDGIAVSAEEQVLDIGSNAPATTLKDHRVRLRDDGSLRGQIHVLDEKTGRRRDVHDLTIHFVRNGVRVAATVVANSGRFVANGLTPGVYSVVAVGKDGVLVSCVDIAGTTEVEEEESGVGEFKPTGAVADLEFVGCPVCQENLEPLSYPETDCCSEGVIVDQEILPCDSCAVEAECPCGGVPGGGGYYGGGGGGYGGGGGGGVGGGGLGLGALLAGGLGAGLGFLLGDDDDRPASPGI